MAHRPAKRRYSNHSSDPSPQRNGQGRAITLDIRPCEPSDDEGWQLRASWADRLFWWHPTRKAKQWATPESVQPSLWRICFEKDGSRSYCHMETSHRQRNATEVYCFIALTHALLLDAPPKPVVQSPMEAPWDWIEEQGTDGSISW
jgi:hypothetical protein